MNTDKTFNLNDIGTCHTFTSKEDRPYQIMFPPEDYLVICCGAIMGTAASRFDHPNILMKHGLVFEFKHYRKGGSKFWTQKPGVEFTFAVPKNKITLVEREGLSYVTIIIGDCYYTLNVSGGGNGIAWTDYVHQGCSTIVNLKLKDLKAIASMAMTVSEVQHKGIKLDMPKEMAIDYDDSRFCELCNEKALSSKLKAGMTVVLKDGYAYMGYTRFSINSYYKKKWTVVKNSVTVQIKSKHIDWTETAASNLLPTVKHEKYNRVPFQARDSIGRKAI